MTRMTRREHWLIFGAFFAGWDAMGVMWQLDKGAWGWFFFYLAVVCIQVGVLLAYRSDPQLGLTP